MPSWDEIPRGKRARRQPARQPGPDPSCPSPGRIVPDARLASGEFRILVADDDLGCLESVRAVLAMDGHKIFTATRGWEAVELARHLKQERRREKRVLDVSILDFHMPDITGLETFQRIVVELPTVQGIVISGEASLVLEQMATQVGVRALLEKPLDLHRIRSVIRSMSRDLLTSSAFRAGAGEQRSVD